MSKLRYQPRGPARIDRANPLTNGLALLVSAGQPIPFDMVRQRRAASTAGWKPAPGVGYGHSTAKAAAGMQLAGTTALVTSNGAFTGEFTVSVYANPASTDGVSIVCGALGLAAPECYFQFNGTLTSASSPGAAAFVISNGGQVRGPLAAGVVDGKFHLFTAARRSDGMMEMWVDDKLVASASAPQAIATAARIDTLYGYASANYGCLFATKQISAHNRALSPDEIAAYAANPWQLFADPDEDDDSALMAPGGPASFTYVPSGGLAYGGAVVSARSAQRSSVGGVQIAGASPSTRTVARATAGGIQVRGSAVQARARSITAAGGAVFGGAATVVISALTQARTIIAAGGIALGGAVQRIATTTRAAVGGLNVGGAAGYTNSGVIARAAAILRRRTRPRQPVSRR